MNLLTSADASRANPDLNRYILSSETSSAVTALCLRHHPAAGSELVPVDLGIVLQPAMALFSVPADALGLLFFIRGHESVDIR